MTTREREFCSDEERHAVGSHTCPDCGAPLNTGPSGGLSTNYYCSAPNCGSGFNQMGPFGVERITNARPKKKGKPS